MAAPAQQCTEILKESHWTQERHGLITQLCQEAVASKESGIRSLSHYTNGILDFAVRRAGRGPLRSPAADADGEPPDESLPGSRLLLCTQDLGGILRPLGTGDLMRTVVANAGGGLWGGRVKAGEFLAALTDEAASVEAMDTAMNTLVTRIRTEVHRLPDELPGGAPGATPGRATCRVRPRIDFGTAAPQRPVDEERLRHLLQGHLNTTDLQYAGYYRDWTLVCVGDVFDAPELGPRFLNISVRSRRSAYRDLSQRLSGHLSRLTDALHLGAPPAPGGAPVDRLVLDVQEGAVYVAWISPSEFVVGVTLEQPQVGNAETRLGRLARALAGVTAPNAPH
ncbi:hypothetical protein Q3V23_34780 [Streptomyces sp. VNUA116]|uniref:hypothetical protein n=1 Tax=Streptomyces sp. VNUA116 TaxID=3062449 RepID=UPI0026765472|nr:hypothetical protein [Streptomyces sp. VNUA116]WKU48812.1 hypothetical protein Q3V23_34780 [Streptomyces sp. VNUA116]